MKRVVINIRASKNISGLVKVSVTSPAGLMKFFLNVEPWQFTLLLCNPGPLRLLVYMPEGLREDPYHWTELPSFK